MATDRVYMAGGYPGRLMRGGNSVRWASTEESSREGEEMIRSSFLSRGLSRSSRRDDRMGSEETFLERTAAEGGLEEEKLIRLGRSHTTSYHRGPSPSLDSGSLMSKSWKGVKSLTTWPESNGVANGGSGGSGDESDDSRDGGGRNWRAARVMTRSVITAGIVVIGLWLLLLGEASFGGGDSGALGMDPMLAIRKYHKMIEKDMPGPELLGFIPNCDRVVMFHDQKGNGLGAQVLRVLDAFLLAKQLNATLLVARQMYWNYGCDMYLTWECYFEPVTPYCEGHDGELRRVDTMVSPDRCDAFRANSYKGRQCVMIADMTAEDEVYHVVHKSDTPVVNAFEETRRMVRMVWKPNKSIRENTEDTLRKMNLLETGFIGLHIRRGDKALEVPPVPVQDYATALKLCESKSKVVFLATDDGRVIWELRDLLPDYTIYTFADPESTGHLQKRANEDKLAVTVVSTMSLISEIDILRKADFFIGTYSSNIGRLVAVLRDQPQSTTISMDHAWSPGVAWRSFNSVYCKSPNPHRAFCDWKSSKNSVADADGFYF